MSEFDEIRPYNDDEVRSVLDRLIQDNEFLDAIVRLKSPPALKPLLGVFSPLMRLRAKKKLVSQLSHVDTVDDLQLMMEGYLEKVITNTVTQLTVSGLDNLQAGKAYLFISNHRDIAMDSAFVNWAIFTNGFSTLRIAIGDNLLTKPFASDLMRLNKTFIVNRSATAPREKFKAAKLLSKYIRHSVIEDNENVWIAQREGRAKDGLDKTNSAIISMISLSRSKQQDFAEYIRESNIIPVSISYEYDPCGVDKASELYAKANEGEYTKDKHEDVLSIAKGITGQKGNVHLAFGKVLTGDFLNAEEVTAKIDDDIVCNYRLHLSNCFAYEELEGSSPKVTVGEGIEFISQDWSEERLEFKRKLNEVEEKLQATWLASYANPVRAKLALQSKYLKNEC